MKLKICGFGNLLQLQQETDIPLLSKFCFDQGNLPHILHIQFQFSSVQLLSHVQLFATP